jgi:TorA maturation chaperone TorD
MVTCDEVVENILKFQDVLARMRRLPVALHLSIHKKETMKLQFFFLPEFFLPCCYAFLSLFQSNAAF